MSWLHHGSLITGFTAVQSVSGMGRQGSAQEEHEGEADQHFPAAHAWFPGSLLPSLAPGCAGMHCSLFHTKGHCIAHCAIQRITVLQIVQYKGSLHCRLCSIKDHCIADCAPQKIIAFQIVHYKCSFRLS